MCDHRGLCSWLARAASCLVGWWVRARAVTRSPGPAAAAGAAAAGAAAEGVLGAAGRQQVRQAVPGELRASSRLSWPAYEAPRLEAGEAAVAAGGPCGG